MSARSLSIVWALAVYLAAAGCVQNPSGTGPADGGGAVTRNGSQAGPLRPLEPVVESKVAPLPNVDHIELEASPPSAVNLDSEPGPDGVILKMRLYNLQQPLAFLLNQGEIEFLLFEGNVKERDLFTATPLNVWRIQAADMRPYAAKTLVGNQYVLTLAWLDREPQTSTITVVARILRPGGSPLYARRVVLTTGPR